MASSLFPNNQLNNFQQLRGALNAIRTGNADALAQTMLAQNPQFRQFMDQAKGKTVDQIAQQYGINLSDVRDLLKSL